jgi:predicted metal-dependent hydrolase
MKSLMIFGKNFKVIERKSDKDFVEFKRNEIIINSCKRSSSLLLHEFLADLLHLNLTKIYEKIEKGGKVEVFGDLDFEIVEKIDNKKQRVAKLKGNKILVKLNAISLPKSALKYVIVHEIAHTLAKRHTKKFWKIIRTIYPKFEKGQMLFLKYGKFLDEPFI